ncbi:MAG: UTP--glucose-1-phosphate uridylyltransferase GalU [Alphaproteobacteria bacterium]
MSMRVRKAVFPVAGLGTRFLPATKAMPKEMLTVVDKPLIQYAFEEAVAAGIEEFIFVTGRGKQALEDHFDIAFELQRTLESRNKTDAIEQICGYLPKAGAIKYVRQTEALGLGHAIWCARDMIGDEPFAILSPDDIVLSDTPCLKQLVDAHADVGGNVIAVMDVPRADTARYGILDTPNPEDRLAEIHGLVEKPSPDVAPSTLSIIGRYILDGAVFAELDRHEVGAGGEIQLTDAMAKLIGRMPCHGLRFDGTRFDCGTKEGWFAANVAYSLAHPTLGAAARATIDAYR